MGSCSALVVSSPKSHSQLVMSWLPGLDSSVNWTDSGASPQVGAAENAAVGPTGAETVMYHSLVYLSRPATLVTVSETVRVPGAV